MSCDLELTKTEYDVLSLNMSAGTTEVTIGGLKFHMTGLRIDRSRPPRDRYYATVRRILPEREY